MFTDGFISAFREFFTIIINVMKINIPETDMTVFGVLTGTFLTMAVIKIINVFLGSTFGMAGNMAHKEISDARLAKKRAAEKEG